MEIVICIPNTKENLRSVERRFNSPNSIIDIRGFDNRTYTQDIRVQIRIPELDIEPQLTINPYAFETINEAEKYIKSKIKKV